MRKIVLWAAALLLALSFSSARAEDAGLTATATSSVSALVYPTQIEVSVRLAAAGGACERVSLYDGDVLLAGPLTVTGSATVNFPFVPSDGQIGAGATFNIVYTQGGETKSASVTLPIARVEAQPSVSLERTLTRLYAGADGKIDVTYRVRNTGNVDVTGLIVYDPILDDAALALDCLKAGASYSATRVAQVGSGAVSEPSAQYRAAGDTHIVAALEPVKIVTEVALPRAELSISPNPAVLGEPATLTLTLYNDGNGPLTDFAVSGGYAFEGLPDTLSPGARAAAVCKLTLDAPREMQIEVRCVSASGSGMAFYTNELAADVAPSLLDVRLTLTAEADLTGYGADGAIGFTLRLLNDSGAQIRGVRLYEDARGDVRSLLFVPEGGMDVAAGRYAAQSGDTFRFAARVEDAAGNALTVYAEPYVVEPPEPTVKIDRPEVERVRYAVWGAVALTAALSGAWGTLGFAGWYKKRNMGNRLERDRRS